MTIKVNMAGVKETGDPVPPGKYHFRVTDMEEGETSENSKKYPNEPMLTYELTIIDGPEEDRKLYYNCILHPDMFGLLKAMGRCSGLFTEEQMEAEWELSEDGREFIGTEGIASVGWGKGDYKDRTQVKKITPYTEEEMAAAGVSGILP